MGALFGNRDLYKILQARAVKVSLDPNLVTDE